MIEQQAYGFIHCHSEHSIKDSALKIKDMVACAKEMGAKAITLTDHGTCTGIIQLIETCNANGIKPIPGVEAYMHKLEEVTETDIPIISSKKNKRTHLVLLAKNYEGYKEISKAVTESNKYLDCVTFGQKKNYYPIMNKVILKKYFGNGNVIATSACVQSIFSAILLENKEIEREINKLTEAQSHLDSPDNQEYQELKQKISDISKSISQAMIYKEEVKEIASKVYKKRLKGLKAYIDEDYNTYCELRDELDMEMQETEDAKLELKSVMENLKSLRKSKSAYSTRLKRMEPKFKRYHKIQNEITNLKNKIQTEEVLYDKCKNELLWYKDLFDSDFFIEMQYHGMQEEAYVMPILAKLARECNISVVAANDSHIAYKTDVEARQYMKSMRFNKWEQNMVADYELYMKSDEELSNKLLEILPEDVVNEAMNNIRVICDQCDLQIPTKKHYPKYIDDKGNVVEDAPQLLREKSENGISLRFTDDNFNDIYRQRLIYELNTIISMGFADYLLIVADFINYAKKHVLEKSPYNVGYAVGPGRGSAAGSLVCYLLGITNIDPVKYNLKFERFLNIDRVTMPDIDTDFSAEIRMDVIEYVKEKYGKESVALIRTMSTQAAKAAVHTVGRMLGIKENKPTTYYSAYSNNIANMIPKKQNITLHDCEETLNNTFTSDIEKKIINGALSIEGTMTGLGTHAAGVIIGDGNPLSDYIPLFYNTNMNQWAVQCDKEEAERIGLLKMDFLGLKNLDVLSETIRRIKKYENLTIDLDNIPFEPAIFKEIYSKGLTKSVFQTESAGMRDMLKKFEPECFDDIILAIAAYRPGPMDFIPDIIAVKQGKKKPYYCIPELESILTSTYGYPIYQEQLMDIFAVCAGFTQGEADIIRRYMSKKKKDKFIESKPKFIEGIISHGASEKDAVELWDSLVTFSEYAFNKSHATAYAVVSYQTAWLKYHYPKYYMCAVLNQAKLEKIGELLYECEEMNISIIAPDINKSYENFENHGDSILYGLGKIKSVKGHAVEMLAEREKNGRFVSFCDFIYRTSCDKGVLEALIKSGVFDILHSGSRKSLLDISETISSLCKDLKSKIKTLEILKTEYKDCDTGIDDSRKKIENCIKTIKRIKKDINACKPDIKISDGLSRLQDEYEFLGAYISAHPLDAYRDTYKSPNITLVSDFQQGNYTFAGMIKTLRVVKRKSDGAPMAFFQLEDISGSIEVACFAKEYKKFHTLIKDGNVVKIQGFCKIEDGYNDGESINKLTVMNITKCMPYRKPIFVSIPNSGYERYAYEVLSTYEDKNGHPIWLHTQNNGLIENKNLYVSSMVADMEFESMFVDFVFLKS